MPPDEANPLDFLEPENYTDGSVESARDSTLVGSGGRQQPDTDTGDFFGGGGGDGHTVKPEVFDIEGFQDHGTGKPWKLDAATALEELKKREPDADADAAWEKWNARVSKLEDKVAAEEGAAAPEVKDTGVDGGELTADAIGRSVAKHLRPKKPEDRPANARRSLRAHEAEIAERDGHDKNPEWRAMAPPGSGYTDEDVERTLKGISDHPFFAEPNDEGAFFG